MTVTHETPEQSVQEAPKRKGKKRAPETTPADVPATDASATEQPSMEPTESDKPAKRAKLKKVAKGPAPEMTLAALGQYYLAHLEATKSAGTVASYAMEVDRAVSYLGADTPIGTLTPDDILRFNGSRVVMCKKDGKPKAAPSYLKTQRVLRLALVWAADERKWIESAPIPQDEAETK